MVHYVLPLAALMLLGVKPRTAATLAILGVISDVDALMLIHRSISHSILIMGLIIAPLLVYAKYRRPDLQNTLLLAFLVLASHPILDLESLTPIFWPLLPYSLSLKLSLNGVIEEGLSLRPLISMSSQPTIFTKATGLDYPLFTQEGLLISLILLAPIIYNQIKKR